LNNFLDKLKYGQGGSLGMLKFIARRSSLFGEEKVTKMQSSICTVSGF